jgi:large subunit ribosomal protein L15
MGLHNLKPSKGAIHKEKRIARGEGSGHGGTSTKGHKGMKARAGADNKIGFEGGQTPLQRRLPKVGFKNISRVEYNTFNLDQLNNLVERFSFTEITPEILSTNHIVSKKDKIKILGRGELKSKLNISVHACSATATEKIKAAGGSIELIQK